MAFWLRLLWFAAKAAVLAFAVVWLAGIGGAVTIAFRGTLIETTLGMLAIAVLVIAGLAVLLARLWRDLRELRGRLSRRFERRRLQRGYGALAEGFSALASGQPAQARAIAARLEKQSETRPLAVFLAGLAARDSGDAAEAAARFRALLDDPHAGFLGVRGLLSAAAQTGDRAALPGLIGEAHRLKPESPWAAQAQFKLAVEDHRFEEARAVLQTAKAGGGMESGEAQRLEAAVAVEQAKRAAAAGDSAGFARFAREAQRFSPGFVPAIVVYADSLLAQGKRRRAVRLLEKAWVQSPHPDLVRPFLAAAPEPGDLGRAAWSARLLALTPHNPEAQLAQAEAALKAGLWGEAKRLLQPLLAAEPPDRRVLRLQAELARARPNGEAGTPETWLAKAADAPPDPAWVCSACGTRHPQWAGLCRGCGAFATLGWEKGGGPVPRAAAAPSDAFALLGSEPRPAKPAADGGRTA
jgi:HemY protein